MNRESNGLGLSICKQIAINLNGSLSVISELGCGSTFTLHLIATKAMPSQSMPNREKIFKNEKSSKVTKNN
jgi:K+-sensing histidine kinase KdpD